MIDLKHIKALIKLMVDNNLSEVDLQDEQGERVKLKRGSEGQVQYAVPMPAAQPVAAAPAATEPAAPVNIDEGLKPIPSVLVGTFYAAAGPDSPPFVKVGDKVGPETVVCIVEAMKVFNEVKAGISGTIERICVDNGDVVEHAQPLFMVRPS